jgi:hypothetical protein
MTRYVGTGEGEYLGFWYRYRPSVSDRLLVRGLSEEVHARAVATDAGRGGYGPRGESRPEWIARGILGEVAALYPIGYGPDLDAWRGSGRWKRAADLGPLEVRTTGYQALRGGSPRYPTLGGWPIMSKDRGRIILAVEDRYDDLVVMGWTYADDVPRLGSPLGGILAVIEPPDLRPLDELEPYAATFGR